MNRKLLERWLTSCLIAVVVLPVSLAVLLGLGSLLGALGDAGGAAICGRVALGAGVLFVVALVATTAASALTVLTPPRHRRPRRRRRRPEGRDTQDRPLGLS